MYGSFVGYSPRNVTSRQSTSDLIKANKMMYTPLENVFNATMEREGRTVTAVTSGSTFQAFMRREDDNNTNEDRIRIYYGVDAPVNQGSIIAYGTKRYILVNRETEENSCYYKSFAVACNGVITLNDGTITGVPAYTADMQRALEWSGQVITVIQGNMEFWCENNATTRQFKVNDEFNEFGRTFKITNCYYKDGIVHLICEVTLTNPHVDSVNQITISGISSEVPYTVGDYAEIEVTLTTNGEEVNGTVTFESSDTSVATVDNQGVVSFEDEGTASISVYWVEQNIYESVTVNVSEPVIQNEYRIGMTASGNSNVIKVGGSKTVTCKLYENGNEITLTDAVAVWTYDTSIYTATTSYNSETNKATIRISNGNDIGENAITLTVTEPHHNASGTMTFDTAWL